MSAVTKMRCSDILLSNGLWSKAADIIQELLTPVHYLGSSFVIECRKFELFLVPMPIRPSLSGKCGLSDWGEVRHSLMCKQLFCARQMGNSHLCRVLLSRIICDSDGNNKSSSSSSPSVLQLAEEFVSLSMLPSNGRDLELDPIHRLLEGERHLPETLSPSPIGIDDSQQSFLFLPASDYFDLSVINPEDRPAALQGHSLGNVCSANGFFELQDEFHKTNVLQYELSSGGRECYLVLKLVSRFPSALPLNDVTVVYKLLKSPRESERGRKELFCRVSDKQHICYPSTSTSFSEETTGVKSVDRLIIRPGVQHLLLKFQPVGIGEFNIDRLYLFLDSTVFFCKFKVSDSLDKGGVDSCSSDVTILDIQNYFQKNKLLKVVSSENPIHLTCEVPKISPIDQADHIDLKFNCLSGDKIAEIIFRSKHVSFRRMDLELEVEASPPIPSVRIVDNSFKRNSNTSSSDLKIMSPKRIVLSNPSLRRSASSDSSDDLSLQFDRMFVLQKEEMMVSVSCSADFNTQVLREVPIDEEVFIQWPYTLVGKGHGHKQSRLVVDLVVNVTGTLLRNGCEVPVDLDVTYTLVFDHLLDVKTIHFIPSDLDNEDKKVYIQSQVTCLTSGPYEMLGYSFKSTDSLRLVCCSDNFLPIEESSLGRDLHVIDGSQSLLVGFELTADTKDIDIGFIYYIYYLSG